MPTLYPTFHCFDDALDLIGMLLTENPDDRDHLSETLVLVHGICRAPDGNLYSHAWVEYEEQAFFRAIIEGEPTYVATSIAEFATEFQVQACTRYSVREAAILNRQSGHYGPWLPQYKALCHPRREE